MQHLAIVDVLQTEAHLREPVQNTILREEDPFLALQALVQVAAGAVVHHDAQPTALGEGLVAGDDVGMMQRAEELRLKQAGLPLAFRHLRHVHLFLLDDERRRVQRGVVDTDFVDRRTSRSEAQGEGSEGVG